MRLDIFLARAAFISRSKAQQLISSDLVTVDGKHVGKNYILQEGEIVSWKIPPPESQEMLPEKIPLNIVFEDNHIIVVDKPAGLVMYPAPGHERGTLLNALIFRYPEISSIGGRGRCGVFHRLDKGTSGLVAIARSELSYKRMVEKVSKREVKRKYIALVTGEIPVEEGIIDAPIARNPANRKKMAVRAEGKKAISRFKVLRRFKNFTLVEVSLETGRTHQIRVHFSYIGHPVAGDLEYSRGRSSRALGLERQFLHAAFLSFEHPVSGENLEFTSDLPEDLKKTLQILSKLP